MPIPAAQIQHAEIAVFGRAATGGSSTPPAINIFHYRRIATAVAPSKAALNTIFQATVMAPLLLAMNVRYTPSNLGIRWLNDAEDGYQTFAVAGVGAIGTDSLPSDTAVYFLYRTALRGKFYRGSKHFGPASEVDTTNDLLTGAGLVRWQTVQTALAAGLTDASPNTWVPCVYSRTKSQSVLNPTTIIANDITQVLLDLNLGTMRKRRSKTVR